MTQNAMQNGTASRLGLHHTHLTSMPAGSLMAASTAAGSTGSRARVAMSVSPMVLLMARQLQRAGCWQSSRHIERK